MSLKEALKVASKEEKQALALYLDGYLSDVSEAGDYWSESTIIEGMDEFVLDDVKEVVHGIKEETAVGDIVRHDLKVSVHTKVDGPVVLNFPYKSNLLIEKQELANLGHLFIALVGSDYDRRICQEVLEENELSMSDLAVRIDELMKVNDGLPRNWGEEHINNFLSNRGCKTKADAFRLGQMNFAAMLVPRSRVGMDYSTKTS